MTPPQRPIDPILTARLELLARAIDEVDGIRNAVVEHTREMTRR